LCVWDIGEVVELSSFLNTDQISKSNYGQDEHSTALDVSHIPNPPEEMWLLELLVMWKREQGSPMRVREP
jgi:hypothetical protein